MSLVYQTEMVLRLVGYSAEEIEEMDLDSIHRVIAFKELIIAVLGEAVQKILGSFDTGGGSPTNHYDMPIMTPDDMNMGTPFG